MATFTYLDGTSTTLEIRVSGLPSGTRVVDWYIGTSTSSMPYDGYENTTTTSCTHIFEDLEPDTKYYVKVKACDSSGDSLGVFTSSSRYGTEAEEVVVDKWQLGKTSSYLNIVDEESESLSFGKAGYVARFKVSFTHSGEAKFYSTGSSDTYGYLSTVSTLDADIGGPTDYLKRNDDSGSGNNFRIYYNVKAGTTYYLWVRMLEIDMTGSTTVVIQPPVPWKLGTLSSHENIAADVTEDLSFGKAGYVARIALTFSHSGTASFYSLGASDTYGILSNTEEFDEGEGGPTLELKHNDDGGSDTNFLFTYDVEAGTTYYLWVRMLDIDETGTTTVVIEPPPILIELWKWDASNGDATRTQTKAAYTAITGQGAISDFSYKVWNDLVNKVNSVKEEVGVAWNSKYLTISKTRMTSSDKTLTADRFNSLRYNIGIHETTGLNEVYAGNQVYGSYFTDMTDALNTWIDTLNGN